MLADGSSAHTEKWITDLEKNGIKIFLFSLRPLSNYLAKKNQTNNILSYSCDISLKSNASIFKKSTYLKILPQLKREIKQFQPDLLHAHYISSYGLLAYLSGFRPYVLSVWGSDILVFPKRSIIHKTSIKTILKNATKVFATSQLMLDVVQNQFGKKESMRLPFGIDTKQFKPLPQSAPDRPFTFIILKSLTTTYGIDIAIEAFSKLKMQLPNKPMHLLIYGDGEKRKEYETLAGELLNECIFFKGKIPNSEASNALQHADVFINISRNESFGVSVLEASACGLPVIVSNKGGLPETVIPNETGTMLEELTADCCATAMEAYLKDNKKRHEHGNNGRAFVLKNYRQEEQVQLQLDAYRELIGEV